MMRYTFFLCFGIFFQFGFAQIDDNYGVPPPPPERIDCGFEILEERPRFPGCEDMFVSFKKRKTCADEKFFNFMNANLSFPPGIENQGKSLVSFIIDKDGAISNIQILESLGYSFDREIIKVLKSMPKWIPGRQRGRLISTQLILPIQFILR